MNKILNKYQNGNVQVTLYDDGTKVLEYDGVPEYDFPTSMDCKITQWCDLGCDFCHELSNKNGKHGDLDKLSEILSILPAGTELAIGGGHALAHPDIVPFLERCKKQGLICNITVNQKHLKNDILLKQLVGDKLVYGVGISVSSPHDFNGEELFWANYLHTVIHLILGINTPLHAKVLQDMGFKKFLLLGYKEFGRGIKYYESNQNEVNTNIAEWKNDITGLFGTCVLSFDNLAIEQIDLQSLLPPKLWERFYMGDDFSHTMYIDAVEQKFAPTSRSEEKDRVKWKDVTLLDYFKENRRK